MGTALRLMFCLVFLFLVAGATFLWLPTSVNYHITERYQLSTDSQPSKIYLGLIIPKSGPYQRVTNVKIRFEGEQAREPKTCVELVKLVGDFPASYQTEAVIEYDVSVSYGLVYWSDSEFECEVLPDETIESEHPLIQERAGQLASGVSLWDAYRIYSFTAGYLNWSTTGPECDEGSSAVNAYLSGYGACAEFSRLMTALTRAVGIPSHPVSGVMMPELEFPGMSISAEMNHPGEAHAWVEFSNGYIWTMADPSWGSSGFRLLQFGRNDGRHVRFGGFDLEGEVYRELREWATSYAPLAAKRFAALKYVMSTDQDDVHIWPSVTVRKGWDGRWLNVFIVLVFATLLFCYLRGRIIDTENGEAIVDQSESGPDAAE